MLQHELPARAPLFPTLFYMARDFLKIGRKARREVSRKKLEQLLSDSSIARVAIDCGANVGEVTAKFVAAGFRVYAFEPDPTAREKLLARNFSKDQVQIYPVAVGVRKGVATLFRREKKSQAEIDTLASSLVAYKKTKAEDNVSVEIIDFVAFVEQLGERIGILKMDIEGSEVDILDALINRGLLSKIDFTVVETHERFNLDLAWRTAQLRARVASLNINNINLDHP
jgi:FkbM family methyltransferase